MNRSRNGFGRTHKSRNRVQYPDSGTWRRSIPAQTPSNMFRKWAWSSASILPSEGRDIALRCPRPRSSGRNDWPSVAALQVRSVA
jgi:hypothetical protein